MQNTLKKSFLKACLDISGIYFCISLFLSVVNFTNNILIIAILYKIFNYPHFDMKWAIEVLLVLMASRFFLGCLQLVVERKIRKKFSYQLSEYFESSSWELKNKSLIATIISRDILLLLETIPTISKLFYFPICFAIGMIVIYHLIGSGGIIAISSVILFIPLSMFIAKKSVKLATNIYDLSKQRLENISKWIEWRSMIFNWAESDWPIGRISQLTQKEIKARSSDSKWRSLDLYIITFGRCLPVAILILISMVLKNDISSQLLLTLWLSVPFIGLIMEAGRFTTDFRLGKKAYNELQQASKPLTTFGSDIVLDDNWEIWDGSLYENCLIGLDNQKLNLMEKLRLSNEFNSDSNGIQLSRFGSNVSEGQKTRILLVRAINLALSTERTLRIERALSSLDPEACRRLAAFLEDPIISSKIILSETCKTFMEHQLARINSASYKDENNFIMDRSDKNNTFKMQTASTSLLKDLFNFFNPLSIAFIFPAISLSLVGYIAIANYTLTTKLLSILTLSILSVALVVFLGTRNETYTREWAKTRLIDILLHAKLKNSVDIFQRLSRDFNTLVERISWYVHDITWLFALVIVSLTATVVSFGISGVLIAGLFLFFSLGIWKIFEKKINTARKTSVETLNQALTMGENLVCFGSLIENTYIRNKRKSLIESNINNLYQSNINLISLKLIFSNLILCVSGFFILATLIGSTYQWINAGSLVFILTAILAVDASLGILFQALSGFSAQRISIHRLTDFDKESVKIQSVVITKDKNIYSFIGAQNPNTGLNYLPITFEAGSSYSILGTSGVGKTQFLKLISGIYDNFCQANENRSGASVLYIDQNFSAIKTWILELDSEKGSQEDLVDFVKHKMIKEKFNIVIFDEALIIFQTDTAKQIINIIQKIVQQTNGMMLFVDHRFTLSKSISISEVQSAINII